MAIKGLTPQLAERGKIKIGGLGEERKKQGSNETYRLPVKHDYITITTMQRDQAGRLMPDKELMDRFMQTQGVQKLTEIQIRLLYDDVDLNFLTRYSCYIGTRCWCTGDGENAERYSESTKKYEPASCPCERSDPSYPKQDKCKTLGTLQVLLEGVDRVGGVWKFRTTSWNTVNAILSSLDLIKTLTGGPLAGIPLWLVLTPKTVSVPAGPQQGKNMVVYVVSLEYRGPVDQLAQIGYEIAKRRIEHHIKMESIEAEARKLLVAPHQEPASDQAETAAEYYPEGTDLGFEQPPGPHVPDSLKVAPAGDGAPKKQRAATAKAPDESKETKHPELQAVTLPELMDLCHKNQDLPIKLPIRSHKPGIGNLATLMEWERLPQGGYALVLMLVPDFDELTDLQPDMIVKSFAEAGIKMTISRPAPVPKEDRIGGARVVYTEEERVQLAQAAAADKVQPSSNGGRAAGARKSLF